MQRTEWGRVIAVGQRVRVGGGVDRGGAVSGTVAALQQKPRGEYAIVVLDNGGNLTVRADRCRPEITSSHRHVLTAPPSYERPRLRRVPNTERWVSPKYAAFVRAHPCCSCGATEGIEASHYGPDSGTARKASDVYLNPLCHSCHREHWPQRGTLPGRSRIQSEGLLIESQRDLLAEWFRARNEEG